MKKLLFILTFGLLIASCQKMNNDTFIEETTAESVTSVANGTLHASITSVVPEVDGKHTINWISGVSTEIHTLHWKVWFGKKRTNSTKLHDFYVWSYDNPNNGPVQMNSSIVLDFSLWDKNWKEATIIGYISEYAYVGSPDDEYITLNATPYKVFR